MGYRSKQVVLILAHKNMSHLVKLINYFQGKCDIFIHVDCKSDFSKVQLAELSKMAGVKRVYKKYSVSWAGFSILKCELFLIEEALKYSNGDYFHLLSGQDYPLQPLDDFLKYFHETCCDGFIKCEQIPFANFDNSTFFRMQYYVLTDWINGKTDYGMDKLHKIINIQKRIGIKRNIPDQLERLYGGSAWFSISKRCANFLYNYTKKHPSFYKRLKYTFYPEEVYVNSVLMNSNFSQHIDNYNNLRCIIWNNPGQDSSPVNLTVEYLEKILKTGKMFFARKFEYPACESLVKIIDKYMLATPFKGTSHTGYWHSCSFNDYDYDYGLSQGLKFLCNILKLKTVIDLGCGPGYYVSDLQKASIKAIGYDGNTHAVNLSKLLLPNDTRYHCYQLDLTEEFYIEHPYDLVLFLNVGEYIPKEYEKHVLDNISNCTGKYLIINWESQKKADDRIKNIIPEKLLINKIEHKGFVIDKLATKVIRDYSRKKDNKENILVFKRTIC